MPPSCSIALLAHALYDQRTRGSSGRVTSEVSDSGRRRRRQRRLQQQAALAGAVWPSPAALEAVHAAAAAATLGPTV